MDPFTIVLLAGAAVMLLSPGQISAAPAPVSISPPREPDISDVITSIITTGIVVYGINELISSLKERATRENVRYDIYTQLKLFSIGLRELPAETFMFIPDEKIIQPLADAMGVGHNPTAIVGVSLPTWARGAKIFVEALADMRIKYNAPETAGCRLPPSERTGAHRDYNSWEWQHSPLYWYYKNKGVTRDTTPVDVQADSQPVTGVVKPAPPLLAVIKGLA